MVSTDGYTDAVLEAKVIFER